MFNYCTDFLHHVRGTGTWKQFDVLLEVENWQADWVEQILDRRPEIWNAQNMLSLLLTNYFGKVQRSPQIDQGHVIEQTTISSFVLWFFVSSLQRAILDRSCHIWANSKTYIVAYVDKTAPKLLSDNSHATIPILDGLVTLTMKVVGSLLFSQFVEVEGQ